MDILSSVVPVFRAVVRTVVPEANQLDGQGWLELESLVETTLRDRPARMQRQFLLFLHAIEWLCVLRFGRRFTSLKGSERIRVLSYLQDHPIELIRCGFWGVRTLAGKRRDEATEL